MGLISRFDVIVDTMILRLYGKGSCKVWASCQIRKIAGAHAPGMLGTFSPSPQVSDPDMHHGTCVTHLPWCMPGSLTIGFLWNRRRGENVPGIPGACATCNFTYLVRGPLSTYSNNEREPHSWLCFISYCIVIIIIIPCLRFFAITEWMCAWCIVAECFFQC